jgi:hypothetical protein
VLETFVNAAAKQAERRSESPQGWHPPGGNRAEESHPRVTIGIRTRAEANAKHRRVRAR